MTTNEEILRKLAIYIGNIEDFPELFPDISEKPPMRYPQLIYQIRERKIDLTCRDWDDLSYAVRESENSDYHIGFISVNQVVNEIALVFNITSRKAREWFQLWFYATLKSYDEWRKTATDDGMTVNRVVEK